jgi:hypothetical protein
MSPRAQWITIDPKLSFRDDHRNDEYNFNSLPLPHRWCFEDLVEDVYATGSGIRLKQVPETEDWIETWYVPPRLGWRFLVKDGESGKFAAYATGYIIVPDNDNEPGKAR